MAVLRGLSGVDIFKKGINVEKHGFRERENGL